MTARGCYRGESKRRNVSSFSSSDNAKNLTYSHPTYSIQN